MKKILSIIAAGVLTLTATGLVSCGGSGEKSSSPEAEMKRNELYDAMSRGNLTDIEMIADSLAFNDIDGLTTDETVAVLIAYLKVHNDAAARKDSQKDLVTLRKFVDVYDIAVARDGDDLIEAFNSARQINGSLDLVATAKEFRALLADYDAGQMGVEPGADREAAPKDTASAKDSSSTEAPAPSPDNGDAPETVAPLD